MEYNQKDEEGEKPLYLNPETETKSRNVETMYAIDINSVREAFEASCDGWWGWEEKSKEIMVSEKLCRLLDIDKKTRTESEPLKVQNMDWWKEYIENNKTNRDFFNQDTKEKSGIETRYTNQRGNMRGYARIKKYIIKERGKNKNKSILYVVEDTTIEVLKNKQMAEKAFSDNLTGLANRAMFEIEIEKLSAEKWRKNLSYSLFIIDIDNFKNLNDTNGHVIGDLFLKEVSYRLTQCLRPTDFIARMGGDEFVVITKYKHGDEKVTNERSKAVAEKIRTEIGRSFFIKDIELNYQCSIGICIEQMQSENTMSILDNADIALYEAKKHGGNKAIFYEEKMRKSIIERKTIKDQITSAVRNKKIKLEIEKIVDISLKKERDKHKKILGYEVLFRCDAIEADVETIIKTAEKSGQIRLITSEVVQEIGNALSNGSLRLDESQTVSINISAIELLDPGFPERFIKQLRNAKINSKQVYIEVTETALISNVAIAKLNIERLRKHGIRFALDDFGTGYASISLLRDISVERIKLDKSYIENIENDVEQALVKTVLWMARALKVELVAEGIEREEQLVALTALGCKIGQGFWLN